MNAATRRNFLLTTSGAMAAALAPRGGWAANTAPKKVRIGIVGGRFGATFQFHEHPDCVVAAISDLRADRRKHLMKTYRCDAAYNSLEEMVKDRTLDAIGVFTDGPLHVQHAELAMKHGKHVISAVPAAWGSLEQAARLQEVVEATGLTYMLAETSYYRQSTISARKFFQEGKFGDLYYCLAAYQHAGLEHLFVENGKRTWRYGMAPMHYPTHCTAMLIGVTGERLTEVTCHGWGNGAQCLKDNDYGNPFWNETAMFRTDKGHAFDCYVWWEGAHRGGEIAEWVGSEMSFNGHHPTGPIIVRSRKRTEQDDGGFSRAAAKLEKYEVPKWWETDMLPE